MYIFTSVFVVSNATQAVPVNEMCKSNYFVGYRRKFGNVGSFSSTDNDWKVNLFNEILNYPLFLDTNRQFYETRT
jgi:hypothetical protein